MDKRFFFAGLWLASSAVNPQNPTLTPPEAYRARVLADDGVIQDYAAVVAAFNKAAEWGLDPTRTHWTSPLFGYRLNGNGEVIVRYCLFGQDGIVSSAGTAWRLVPGVNGKAPQHHTQNVGFTIRGWAWQSAAVLLHVVAKPTSYEVDHYPYFPLIEQDPSNGSYPMLLSIEQGVGVEAGFSTAPTSYAATGAYPSLNVQHAFCFQADPSQPTLEAQRRVWQDGVEGKQQLSTGPLPATLPETGFQLAIRGGSSYTLQGTMNDVLISNIGPQGLPTSARTWLDSRITLY